MITVFIETTCLITMIIGSMILICLLVDKVVGLIRLSNFVGMLLDKILMGIAAALLFIVILGAIAAVAGLFAALVVLLLGVIS